MDVECCANGDGAIQDEDEFVADISFLGNHVMRADFDKFQLGMRNNFREVVAAHALKQG